MIVWMQSAPLHTLTVLSSEELTISPFGKAAKVYMNASWPCNCATSVPSNVHNRMIWSFPADAKAAPEG